MPLRIGGPQYTSGSLTLGRGCRNALLAAAERSDGFKQTPPAASAIRPTTSASWSGAGKWTGACAARRRRRAPVMARGSWLMAMPHGDGWGFVHMFRDITSVNSSVYLQARFCVPMGTYRDEYGKHKHKHSTSTGSQVCGRCVCVCDNHGVSRGGNAEVEGFGWVCWPPD
jgi:hypothetical protein